MGVGKTDGVYLLMFGIFGLSIVGGLSNLYGSSGLINSSCPIANGAPVPGCTPQGFILTCSPPGVSPSPICSNLASVGCQVNNASCTLQGNTGLSVLNPNSPFTTLLSGNFVGFLKSFFTIFNPVTGITLSATPQYPWSDFGAVGSNFQQGFAYCNIPSNPNNVPTPASPKFVDIYQCNVNSVIAGSYSYWATGASTVFGVCLNQALGCGPNGALNVGLPVAPGTVSSPVVNNTMYAFGFNGVLNPGLPLFNGQTGYAIFGSTLINTNFNATYTYQFKVFYQGQTSVTNSPNNIQTLTLLGVALGGIILVLMIFGIAVSAATVSASVNNQSTRLAQAAGISLLIWAPLYSEFSGWLSPSILPNGLDVLIALILTGCIFVGIFIIALTGAAPSGNA